MEINSRLFYLEVVLLWFGASNGLERRRRYEIYELLVVRARTKLSGSSGVQTLNLISTHINDISTELQAIKL